MHVCMYCIFAYKMPASFISTTTFFRGMFGLFKIDHHLMTRSTRTLKYEDCLDKVDRKYSECQVYMTTTSINQFTSSLLLTVMSADRYIAVCHPISSPRYRTPFIAKFICLTVWTVSALLMVPLYLYATSVMIPRGVVKGELVTRISCNVFWTESIIFKKEQAFTLYAFTLGFAIPLTCILVFYFLVIFKLSKVGPKNKSKTKKRSHRKVTYLVLTVVTAYVICWMPYWILQLYTLSQPFGEKSTFHIGMMLFCGCLAYANSAINPVFYAFLSENFKKSFAKAFTCANGTDINNQLHVENSLFPRNTRGGSTRNQFGEEKCGLTDVHLGGGGLTVTTGQDFEPSTALTRAEEVTTQRNGTKPPTNGNLLAAPGDRPTNV